MEISDWIVVSLTIDLLRLVIFVSKNAHSIQ